MTAPHALNKLTRIVHSQGVSLIEVLVAILVVSVGVLALAGLMATSIRLGKTSEFRSVASLLAADVVDRLRANVSAAEGGEYNLRPTALASSRATAPLATCTSTCTAAQIAVLDMAQWQAILYNSLPAGTGYLSYDADTDTADVWVAWRDPSASDADDAKIWSDADLAKSCPPNFSLSPRPVCMYFRVAR